MNAEQRDAKRATELAPFMDVHEQRAVQYINAQIASETREDADVTLLSTRRAHIVKAAERKAASQRA